MRNGDVVALDAAAARAAVRAQADALVGFAIEQARAKATFTEFEKSLIIHAFALARAVVSLFLVTSEERVRGSLANRIVLAGRTFRRAPSQQRSLLTWFGLVRYERTYLREVVGPGKVARGFHPLDAEIGLLADRVSPNLLSIAVRLATRVAFSEARELLGWFLPCVPSTEVIEAATLGYGRYTPDWFEHAPAPDKDGEVLVVQFDSKGVPTATDEELRKRRGKRDKRKKAPSPRHRGRGARARLTRKARRKKGDKAKNAKMGTMVVMYTLRKQRNGNLLLGPINKRFYASFAPKRHAVEIARREATKRGFPPGTKRTVQIVTDGDNDLALYIAEIFPDALHTIDVIHVIEKLWDAGSSIHREGSAESQAWVERQKDALYAGRALDIIAEFDHQLARIPRTGPGNKYRREKLSEVRAYIAKRQHGMNYDQLLEHDLELGTGPVEGAIKNIMRRRMDHGGMRWIKERAESVLQLRCIDTNGDWNAFVGHVATAAHGAANMTGTRIRLQQRQPNPLPKLAEAA